ncbi:unnamed protein product [Spirodela intermedia]|uniref:Uncharacterized protein n=1 Tax=Spirodela intermedia TaxID=51605 RepID=A0A7I8IQR0_SPIIN|nr:unnamed protein product [Spirodela intermedia]CAA6659340.1 unnamed protein product [Spirodela intermedia]
MRSAFVLGDQSAFALVCWSHGAGDDRRPAEGTHRLPRSVRKNKFIDFVGQYHLELLVRYGAAPVIVPRIAGVDEILDGFEPIHGVLLCEGEDVLNVAAGGTLHQDVARELGKAGSPVVVHMDYGNYDGHRHGVSVVAEKPLHLWFMEWLAEEGGRMEMMVRGDGVRRRRPGGGVLGPHRLRPRGGRVLGGAAVHPERMRASSSDAFDYPGCPSIYEDFVRAATAYQRKTKRRISWSNKAWKTGKINDQMVGPKLSLQVVNSALLFLAETLVPRAPRSSLQMSKERSSEEEERLKQMGVTVRNGSAHVEKVKKGSGERGAAAAAAAARVMERMSVEQLAELMQF